MRSALAGRSAFYCTAAVLAAGCAGGGNEDRAAEEPRPQAVGREAGTPAPDVARTLVRFAAAARRHDAAAMWELLSDETRATFGSSLVSFRRGPGRELGDGVGALQPRARVILARRVGRWGVAAIAGERVIEGERGRYAWGAAFVRERGGWKLELGGVAFEGLAPEPLEETEPRPELGVRADGAGEVVRALLWLDGKPVASRRVSELPFTARLSARPAAALAPGFHELVVFAATRDTAGALAWPFEVRG